MQPAETSSPALARESGAGGSCRRPFWKGGMREGLDSGRQRWAKRRALSVTGNTPQINVERNTVRETFTVADARAAMGIDWMPMKSLSQAIPPAYGEWIGRQALAVLS